MTYDRIKRLIDIAVALTVLASCLPLLAAVAVLVRFTLGHPVLFRQRRPGLGGRPFTLVKFRTMHHVDPSRDLVTDEQRLPAVGRLLRALSLDELPTLWNVLRGDMSLVGPRPLLMEYLDHYLPAQRRRHDVRPGVTGFAQVNGRNALTWGEKFELDTWYVEHRSLGLDLRILARTVPVVLRGAGVKAPGSATAPKFAGTTADRTGEPNP